MSLLLKNELRLRLGPQHCDAQIWRAGLRAKMAGHASASGEAGDVIELALAALATQGHELPLRASLWVEDESLYTMMLPAEGTPSDALALARGQFMQLLGHDDLSVQITLAPCGTQWIVIALESALLAMWRETLAMRGIAIAHVRSALLEDMNAMRDDLGSHTGHAVFVRREGASVLGVTPQTVTRIDWERCDVTDPEQLAGRIEAQGLQQASEDSDEALPAVCIVPYNAGQRVLLEDMCAQRGWTLSRALLGVPA